MCRLLAFSMGVLIAADVRAAPASGSVLEPANRHLRGNQLHIHAFGGNFVGGSVEHSFSVGGRLTYYPIRHLGLAAHYGYTRIFGAELLQQVHDRSVHFLTGQLELPLVSALRLGKQAVVEMDLFGQGGAGAIYIADQWEALGVLGGGVRLYPPLSWLAVRIDALTLLHDTRRDTGPHFDTDVSFTLGVEFIVPPRKIPARRVRSGADEPPTRPSGAR